MQEVKIEIVFFFLFKWSRRPSQSVLLVEFIRMDNMFSAHRLISTNDVSFWCHFLNTSLAMCQLSIEVQLRGVST